MFEKYASVDELKADWEIIEESEYDISLDAGEKTVSLKKKNEPSATSQYYDDGIMLQFEQQKPEHVSFYCKTDSQDLESCNFRLFRQGNKEAMGNQWNDKRKINRAEVAIFFRFGFFRHFKINYQVDYLKYRQENDKWYKIDFVMDWDQNKTTMFVEGEPQTIANFYQATDRSWQSKEVDPQHDGVDSIVLYTLSAEATSVFKELQLCKKRCKGGENLKFNNAARGLSSSMGLIVSSLLLYLSL